MTTMESMFMEASAFNQNIGEWDTSQVINMEQMFYSASAFNQDISGWTGTAATTSQVDIFLDATAFHVEIYVLGNFRRSNFLVHVQFGLLLNG